MKMICAAPLLAAWAVPAIARDSFERYVIKTTSGDVEMTFIGHGSLLMKFNGKVIHIDPFSELADYTKLPKADAILVTHEHQDHLDPGALRNIRKKETALVLTAAGAEKVPGGIIMKNGCPAGPGDHGRSSACLQSGA